MVMNRTFLNKALIWKEYRQNRWMLATAFFLTGVVPVAFTLLIGVLKAINPLLFRQVDWSDLLARIFDFDPTFGMINSFTALALGAYLLSQERSENTLEFLVNSPVGRRDIVNAKFAVGVTTILSGVLLVFLFAFCASIFLTAKYDMDSVFQWFAWTVVVMLTIFSLGFFVSTLTGNRLAAGIGAFTVLYFPFFISVMLEKVLASFGVIPWATSKFNKVTFAVADHMTLPNYLTGGIGNLLDIVLILGTTFAFYHLSVFTFERNNLERNGRVLMFGDFKSIMKISGTFVVALVSTAIVSEETKSGTLILILVFAGISTACWGLFSMIYKLRRNVGLK